MTDFTTDGIGAGSVVTVIALAIFGVATLFAVYETVRLWRDSRRVQILVLRMKNGIGRGDELLSRGHVRSLLAICLIGVTTVFDGFVINYAAMEGGLPQAFGMLVFLSIPFNGILLILWWSIVYFNRPSFIVPPHMREDQGLAAVRRAAR